MDFEILSELPREVEFYFAMNDVRQRHSSFLDHGYVKYKADDVSRLVKPSRICDGYVYDYLIYNFVTDCLTFTYDINKSYIDLKTVGLDNDVSAERAINNFVYIMTDDPDLHFAFDELMHEYKCVRTKDGYRIYYNQKRYENINQAIGNIGLEHTVIEVFRPDGKQVLL